MVSDGADRTLILASIYQKHHIGSEGSVNHGTVGGILKKLRGEGTMSYYPS